MRTYTLEAAGFTDSVDVLYVAQMMEKFMEYVKQLREVRKIALGKTEIYRYVYIALLTFCLQIPACFLFQLSEVLVEMGSNVMQVDDQVLALAQREKRACSSIVYSLETMAWPQLHGHAQDFSMVRNVILLVLILSQTFSFC